MVKFIIKNSDVAFFVELNKWSETEKNWSPDCFADLASIATAFEHDSEGNCIVESIEKFYEMIEWWKKECEDWQKGLPCPDSFGDNENVGNGDFWEIGFFWVAKK